MFIKLTSATTGEPVWLNMTKASEMRRVTIQKRGRAYEVTRITFKGSGHDFYWEDVVDHPDSPAFAGISITSRGADAL